MLARSCYSLELIAAAQVAEAGKPGTAQDYMADEPYSAESTLAAVYTGLVACAIGFVQSFEGCKAPAEEGVTEGQLGKVGIDVGILTTLGWWHQNYFDLASEGFEMPDCSRTSLLV